MSVDMSVDGSALPVERALIEPVGVLPFPEADAGALGSPLELLSLESPKVGRRRRLVARLLFLADALGLLVAFLVAGWAFGWTVSPDALGWKTVGLLALVAPVFVIGAKMSGLYETDDELTSHSTADELGSIFNLATVTLWFVFIAGWIFGVELPLLPELVGLWAFMFLAIAVARSACRGVARRSPDYLQNTVILGAGEVGQSLAEKFLGHPEYGINLIGLVDTQPKEARESLNGTTILGGPSELAQIITDHGVERVVVAFSNEKEQDTLDLIRTLKDLDVHVDVVPRLYELISPGLMVHSVAGLPLVAIKVSQLSRSARVRKRMLDLAISVLALILLAPFFIVVAAWIRLGSRGPAFFKQVRMGAGNQPFYLYKFRTMVCDADDRKHEVAHLNMHHSGDPRMFKIAGDPRITYVGQLLRRYSLDELPQLFNILRGEMSLVGPRPLILEEDEHVEGWARRRSDLRPGITGLWQVLGRSSIPFEEMTKLDYLYVMNWSVWTDLKLIVRTIPVVITGRYSY
jgi:exopolysaccharide biosynthesis polyprenyl glycosylphosphotransferase